MSDVKRYHVTEAGLVEGQALGRINVVLGSDYDTAVAVGTAFGNTLERVVAGRDALQVLLTAADERADVLEGLLRTWRHGRDMTLKDFEILRDQTDAALKPASQPKIALRGYDVEAAAYKLAECMNYPWDHMPEKGKDSMRDHAKAIINAALLRKAEQPATVAAARMCDCDQGRLPCTCKPSAYDGFDNGVD